MANERSSMYADRQFNPVKEGLEQTGLYHSIELPDGKILAGAMPIEYQHARLKSFRLPDSLQGTRILDIGPWDGWFTFVESFVTDGDKFINGQSSPIPSLEFYERGELSGQLDNWCGPTVNALSALARTAGFACTEVLRVVGTNACIAAYRKWQTLPPEQSPPPVIIGLTSHRSKGRSFVSAREEYIEFWCQWSESEPAPSIHEVFPEVDGFGVSPLAATVSAPSLLISFRLPPGLQPGLHHARIKIADSHWSETIPFHVDLADITSDVSILSVQDGVAWSSGTIHWDSGGWATAWVNGLSPEADGANTSIWVSGIPHPVLAVIAEAGQVNFKLRALITSGKHSLEVAHRGARSQPMPFEVDGAAPPIRGLEGLSAR